MFAGKFVLEVELRLLAALVSGDRLLTNVLIRPGWYAVAPRVDIHLFSPQSKYKISKKISRDPFANEI